MKILSISPKVPIPAYDGGKLSIFGVLKTLSKMGHEIDFMAYLKDTNYDFAQRELKKYCNPILLNVQTENSYWGMLKNLFSPIPYNISKYHRKELTKSIRNYFKTNSPDIVHVTNLHMAWIVDEIRKLSDVPIVLRQENLEMTIMKRFSEKQSNYLIKWYSFIQYKKFIKYEPFLCGKFDKCIMITQKDAEELKKLNSKTKVVAIPLGIDDNLLNYHKSDVDPHTLAHIGHLDWYPNYDSLSWFLDDIFPKVLNKFPDTKLYIYGGDLPKSLVIPKNIKKNIIVRGFVDDLWSELITKTLAIVPLRIGSGLRVKILEMLAVGQNIISTSIGKEGIDVKDPNHLLIADNPSDFVEKIERFFKNYYNNTEMIKKGKNLIKEHYTWEIIGKRFENVYNELRK